MRSTCLTPLNRLSLAMLTGLSLLITGCATFRENTCEQFEVLRKDTDYTTQYQSSDPNSETAIRDSKQPLRGKPVVVRTYKMRVDPPAIKPCHHLTIHKEVYIQRDVRANQILMEVREFYSAGGKLIATKTESVGEQLRASGYYAAEQPLPIPEKAPPGKYRVVSKLVMKSQNKSPDIVLAKTFATFQVFPR